MATYQLFFQSREKVVVGEGQIRRIGWLITLEAQLGQFLLGCKCLLSRGFFVQEQDPLGEIPRRFSFKMSFVFQRIFALGIFWGGVSRYAATPLIVALSLSHSNITRFRLWSPIAPDRKAFGSRRKKIPEFVQTSGALDVFDPLSGISGPTSRRASTCPNLHA
jgi:hypothetical protein